MRRSMRLSSDALRIREVSLTATLLRSYNCGLGMRRLIEQFRKEARKGDQGRVSNVRLCLKAPLYIPDVQGSGTLLLCTMPPRSLASRRAHARVRTHSLHRDMNSSTALHWPNASNLHEEWMGLCKTTITKMKICGHCGTVTLGNAISEYKFKIRTIQPPMVAPYAYCNAFLISYIHIDETRYYICHLCAQGSRTNILSFMSPGYIRSVLKAKPLYLQLLSLVDCRLGILNKFNGFHSGFVRNESLLDSPLITWNLDTL